MNGVILSSYFTKKKHPNHELDNHVIGRNNLGFVDNDQFSYIKNWYNSITKLKLNGVIFHDNLSEAFVNKHQSEYIKFERVEESNWSNNDYRFYCFRDYLKDKEYDWVFHADVSDVVTVKDPSKLLLDYKDHQFFACQDTCKTQSDAFNYIGIHKSLGWDNLFLFVLNAQNWDLINMGVVGGSGADMKEFYETFCEIRNQTGNPEANINMYLCQYLLRAIFRDKKKTLIGEPVTSKYKAYENNRKDVYFIHK